MCITLYAVSNILRHSLQICELLVYKMSHLKLYVFLLKERYFKKNQANEILFTPRCFGYCFMKVYFPVYMYTYRKPVNLLEMG